MALHMKKTAQTRQALASNPQGQWQVSYLECAHGSDLDLKRRDA
jgi:hypothetical protein